MKLNRFSRITTAAVLTFGLTAAACNGDDDTPATGDGDGDNGDGDGDNGDGDGDNGDGDTGGGSGDGDGDTGGSSGDGDGDTGGTSGDGDGDTGGMGGGNGDDFAPINQIFAGPIEAAAALYGVSITDDGLIYAAGEIEMNTGTDLDPVLDMHTVVLRFTSAGALDTTFGDEGVVLLNAISVVADDVTEPAPGHEATSSIAALPDGGAVVGIEANDGALGMHVVLARLDSNGDLVETFGTDGYALVPLSGYDQGSWQTAGGTDGPTERIYDIRLDTTGSEDRLVLFAYGPAPMEEDPARLDTDRYIARVMASDGSLDTSFSDDGLFSIDFGDLEENDNAKRGTVLADGSVYSYGYTNFTTGRHHVLIVGLNSDGDPMDGFGFQADETTCGTAQAGVICSNPFLSEGGFAEAYSGTVQSDGSIVTGGYGRADNLLGVDPDLVSFRFGPTSMDTTYGVAGAFIVDSGDEDRSRDVVVLADDRAVHVGKNSGVAGVYVATPDGALWDGFGDGGVRTYPTHTGNLRGVATKDGLIAAVGDSTADGHAFLVVLEVGE